MRAFDPRPLLDFVLSYWRDYYGDKGKMVRYWEGLVRLMDDEWAQAEQANDASNVWSCPTFTYHTYIHRQLENWHSYNVAHFHNSTFFRALAGQTIFYIGAWVSPDDLAVFVDGKELDSIIDPFIVSQDQDATQPGVNPSGSRLIFTNPRAAGQPIHVYSSREMFREVLEVPPGGINEELTARTLDPYSARVVLEKLNLTRFLTLTATSFSRPGGFAAGEAFSVEDAGVVQVIQLSAAAVTVAIPLPVNPLTAQVYKKIGLDITEGAVWLDGKILRSTTPFPVAQRVRITDVFGTISLDPTTPSTSLDLGRVVDEASAQVYYLSGTAVDGYVAYQDGFRFTRSFQEGTVILIEAAIDEPNDHAEHHEKTSLAVDQILVSATRPFVLSPLLTEKPGFPIQVYVSGILLPSDIYTFLSTTTIQLPAFIPANTEIDVHYVDLEDPRPHRHIDFRVVVAQPVQAYELPDYVSPDWARYVSVDGAVVGDPDERWFLANGRFVAFRQTIPTGSVIRVRGARKSYYFWHDIDPEIVRAEFLQDGIDELSAQIPAGWTEQLAWEDGFLITKGLLESNAQVENAWLVNAYVDDETGYKNFGQLIGFRHETSDEYMRMLRALFSGSYMGCQRADIESLICVLMGSQYLSFAQKVISVDDGVVTAERETLNLDADVPARVRANTNYDMLWAVSEFASVVDEAPEDFLPQAAEDLSDDYRYAHTLDTRQSIVFDGGPGDFYTAEDRLEDLSADFIAENVWPGDLVRLDPVGYSTVYCRVLDVVDEHNLIVDVSLLGQVLGYGQDGYGQWVYGGGILIISNVSYRIWVRELDRLDEGEQLDRARAEDIPALNDSISSLLAPFVFKVRLAWAGLRSEQALNDVKDYLDRSKPAESGYLVYAGVNDEAGLVDQTLGALVDQDPVIEEYPDFAYVDEGIVGINGQTSPNAGSFVGV